MLSLEARDELRRKMDETIMTLVALARTEDDVSRELLEVSRLMSEAKHRLEAMLRRIGSAGAGK